MQPVSGQRLAKQIPTETNTHVTLKNGVLCGTCREVLTKIVAAISQCNPREGGVEYSTVALRVVGGDEKRTQCLGVYVGHPLPGGYKYGDLALRVGGFSNLRQ
jgi:hypothetical protein